MSPEKPKLKSIILKKRRKKNQLVALEKKTNISVVVKKEIIEDVEVEEYVDTEQLPTNVSFQLIVNEIKAIDQRQEELKRILAREMSKQSDTNNTKPKETSPDLKSDFNRLLIEDILCKQKNQNKKLKIIVIALSVVAALAVGGFLLRF